MSEAREPRDESHEATATFEVVNALGLHARAAAKLVRLAATFQSEIELRRDGQTACCKSVMGVLLLCCERGAQLEVRAQGVDAQEAVLAIGALFADRFGESE